MKKFVLSVKYDKSIQSINSLEAYGYGTSNVCKKEEIKCNSTIKQYKKD